MGSRRIGIMTLAGIVALGAVAAGAAEIGDPAAPLKVGKWVKGEPVDLKAGKGSTIYVVEFWATWCPPCRTTIPHLTKLQEKYRDKNVVFVGISSSDKDLETVEAFVKDQGDKMKYAVAWEDRSVGATSKAYMTAYKQRGIPTAFIVDKQGRIVWVGHPMRMDQPLAQIVDGTFDLDGARKAHALQEKETAVREKVGPMMQEYFVAAAAEEGDVDLDALGEKIYTEIDEFPELLNAFAWHLATAPGLKERDLELAGKAAKKGIDLTDGKEASIIDTYARALWDGGQKEKAIAQQRLAVATASEEMKTELQATLDKYEKDQ